MKRAMTMDNAVPGMYLVKRSSSQDTIKRLFSLWRKNRYFSEMIRGYSQPKEARIKIITEERKLDYDSPLRAFRYIDPKISLRKLSVFETRNAMDTFIGIPDMHMFIRSEIYAISLVEIFCLN
jgi:hypothetical protein